MLLPKRPPAPLSRNTLPLRLFGPCTRVVTVEVMKGGALPKPAPAVLGITLIVLTAGGATGASTWKLRLPLAAAG